MSFTQDPGAWRPEGATSIDASQLDGLRIVFEDCAKSLNKAITAINRGNLAALSTNVRQFGRAWTKVEQIYRVGMCDF